MNNQLLNANEVTERLSASEKQVFAIIRSENLPAVHSGRWVCPEDLEMFITKNPSRASDFIKTELAVSPASLGTDLVNPSSKGIDHD